MALRMLSRKIPIDEADSKQVRGWQFITYGFDLLSNTIFPVIRHCWRWMPTNPVEYEGDYGNKGNQNTRTMRMLSSREPL